MQTQFAFTCHKRVSSHFNDVSHFDEFFKDIVVKTFGKIVACDVYLEHSAFILYLYEAGFTHDPHKFYTSANDIASIFISLVFKMLDIAVDVEKLLYSRISLRVVFIWVDPHLFEFIRFFNTLLYIFVT